MAKGVVQPSTKGKKKKFWPSEGGRTTLIADIGVAESPNHPRPLELVQPSLIFFFFFGLLGVAEPPLGFGGGP
jgi:hypothetical protein